MDRRTLLRWTTGVIVAGVAGCAGGNDADGGEDTPMETATVSSTPSPTATPEPTPTETETPTPVMETTEPTTSSSPTATPSPTPTPEPTASVAQFVKVGPNGSFRFKPDDFTIEAGETVRWVWRAGGHNVKAESTPSGSDWSGTPGGEFDTFAEDHTYSYTFEVAGQYEYYCGPHRSSGMTGGFTVE